MGEAFNRLLEIIIYFVYFLPSFSSWALRLSEALQGESNGSLITLAPYRLIKK